MRSLWPILPKTRPSGEVMPSMAYSGAVGVEVDVDGGRCRPDQRTGWRSGRWPPAGCISSSEARNRPSPWEMGTVYTSPTLVSASHGDLLEATRVRTMRRLVAADGVEGQGGAGLVGVDDLAVGHQTQLDQRLEAVADAAASDRPGCSSRSVTRLLDGGVAEERGDELAGAVRLVAAGEAAGDERPSGRSAVSLCKALRRLRAMPSAVRLLMTMISGSAPASADGLGGVVFAVGAGEDGDQHLGLGDLDGGRFPLGGLIGEGLHALRRGRDVAGVDGLQLVFVGAAEPRVWDRASP